MRFVDHALVDQVLEREEPGDVGLRFLERAAGFFQLLAHGRLAAVDRDVVRSEPVHHLVHHDVGEERVESEVYLVGRRKHDLAIGMSVLANFASCTFFSMTRFEPFSRVTRSSFGKLKAAVCTP